MVRTPSETMPSSSTSMRLNRFLARCGAASRRGADRLIADGRIRVNGANVTEPGVRIDPDVDSVEFDGTILHLPEQLTCIALNKPAGYVVTMSDPQGRKTVAELIANAPRAVVPVGRLDAPTEGLLLLTDDGELAHRIAHPSFEIDKVYSVVARGILGEHDRVSLEHGVVLDGRRTSPAAVEILATNRNETHAFITIHEGRKRQIRRMFEEVGHPVQRLTRVRVGPVELGNLRSGHWRHLTSDELTALRTAVGLAAGLEESAPREDNGSHGGGGHPSDAAD